MKIFKKISTKSLLLILGIVIGTGISVVWASATWRGVGKINTVISENRVARPDELKDIRDDLEFLHKNMIILGFCQDERSFGNYIHEVAPPAEREDTFGYDACTCRIGTLINLNGYGDLHACRI